MAATIQVTLLLLLGLIVICSAALTQHQKEDTIGPFNKDVLIGRGLAAQRRGFYNNDCNVEKCWDAFYKDAFKDLSSCNTAMEDLKICVNVGMTSEDLCTCNFDQVMTSLGNIDDKMCSTLHNTNFGKCADAKATVCLEKSTAVSQMMMSNPAMSDDDKKTIIREVDDCMEEVVKGDVSTAGCSYMFPKGKDDPMFAINILAMHGWAEGCDEFRNIAALCPRPLAVSAKDCSDENDVVVTFMECAKKELTSNKCQDFLSDAEVMLNEVNDAACTSIQHVQQTIASTCGEEGRKRILLKRLLNLLGQKYHK